MTKDFIINDKIYTYDFNELEIEQAELAREVGEFKHNQMSREPDKLNDILRSQGADWLSIIIAYLVKEKTKDIIQTFNRGLAETSILENIKKLPIKYIKDMNEVVDDFFLNIGKPSVSSMILRGVNNKNAIKMLSQILGPILSKDKENGTDLLKNSEEKNIATI